MSHLPLVEWDFRVANCIEVVVVIDSRTEQSLARRLDVVMSEISARDKLRLVMLILMEAVVLLTQAVMGKVQIPAACSRMIVY